MTVGQIDPATWQPDSSIRLQAILAPARMSFTGTDLMATGAPALPDPAGALSLALSNGRGASRDPSPTLAQPGRAKTGRWSILRHGAARAFTPQCLSSGNGNR